MVNHCVINSNTLVAVIIHHARRNRNHPQQNKLKTRKTVC